jgi:hypothetical protein
MTLFETMPFKSKAYIRFNNTPVSRIVFDYKNDTSIVFYINAIIENVDSPSLNMKPPTAKVDIFAVDQFKDTIFSIFDTIITQPKIGEDTCLLKLHYAELFPSRGKLVNVFSDPYKMTDIFIRSHKKNKETDQSLQFSPNDPERVKELITQIEKEREERSWESTNLKGNKDIDVFYNDLRRFFYNEFNDQPEFKEFFQHRDSLMFRKYEKATDAFGKDGEIVKDLYHIEKPIEDLKKLYVHFTNTNDPYVKNTLHTLFDRDYKMLLDSIIIGNRFKYQQEIIDSLEQLKSTMDAANGLPIPQNYLSPIKESIHTFELNEIEYKLNQIVRLIAVESKLTTEQLKFVEFQIIPMIRTKIKETAVEIVRNRNEEKPILGQYEQINKALDRLIQYLKDNPDFLINKNLFETIANLLPNKDSDWEMATENIRLKETLDRFIRFNTIDCLNQTLQIIRSFSSEAEGDTMTFALLNRLVDLGLSDSLYSRNRMSDIGLTTRLNEGLKALNLRLSQDVGVGEFIEMLNEYLPSPPGITEVKNVIYESLCL